FQAEDGIRGRNVTGVQTCALPICTGWWNEPHIGPEWLILNGVGVAFGITLLSTGLENRRALFTSLSVVALTLVLYLPVQWLFERSEERRVGSAGLLRGGDVGGGGQ